MTHPLVTRRRVLLLLALLVPACAVVLAACCLVGSGAVSVGEAWHALGHPGEPDSPAAKVIYGVRVPRVLSAAAVGAGLAVAGVILQALLKNPLADPFILGVTAGCALGVTLGTLLGIAGRVAGLSSIALAGFAGGLLAMSAVWRLGTMRGRAPTESLLLAGVCTNAVASSLTLLATSLLSPEKLGQVTYWMMGSIRPGGAAWTSLAVQAALILGGTAVAFLLARPLNLMAHGEETAAFLGVEVRSVRRVALLVAALVTAASVALGGIIGFVGILVPHACRMVVGPDHRLLLPASLLVGGAFLALADTLARTVGSADRLAVGELPVGAITALVGGPVFVWLMRRRYRA